MRNLKPIKVNPKVEEAMDEEEQNEPLSPMARMFHEPDTNIYIVVKFGLKKQVNVENFKAALKDTFVKHPRFSSLQVADDKRNDGTLYWVPTEVDLEKHVLVPNLKPNNIEFPDRFVEDYIYNLSKTNIDSSMPMWDFHILNLKTSDAESICVFRAHHSLGDGISLMSLLFACPRKVTDLEKLPTISIKKKVDSKGGLWKRLFIFFLLFWNTIVDVMNLLATSLKWLEDTQTPIKGSNVVGSCISRRIVHRTFDLDDVKLVKNAMGVTINDVLLGVTQASLSRYLNRKYGKLPSNKRVDISVGEGENYKGKSIRENNNLPSNILVRAVLFMNLRPSPGVQELADMMKKGSKERWGNQAGFVILPLTIALRKNPLDYVRDAKAIMDRKKASMEALLLFHLTKYSLKFSKLMMGSIAAPTTLSFSNVPGPQEEISFCNNPVAYVAPSSYGQPTALQIHVASYANKIIINLAVDDNIIPNPHQLCDDFEVSLKLMKMQLLLKE